MGDESACLGAPSRLEINRRIRRKTQFRGCPVCCTTCRQEGTHVLEVVGCGRMRPDCPASARPYQRTMPSMEAITNKAADPRAFREAKRSKSGRHLSFDGDASLLKRTHRCLVPTAVQQRTFRAKAIQRVFHYLSDPESTMKIRLYSKRLQFVIDAGLCGVAWVLALPGPLAEAIFLRLRQVRQMLSYGCP